MRISVQRSSPFFRSDARKSVVTLDGIRVSGCFEADEEAGVVYCHARDENGRLLTDSTGESLQVIERRGCVAVLVPGPKPLSTFNGT